MYSVLLSDYEKGIELVKTNLQNMIKNTYKVVIISWTFPSEIDFRTFNEQWFPKNGRRYNKYVGSLIELGVVQETELLYTIKHYKGIIIGFSAGAELQLKRYFITAKNNYYKYFAFYDGFGILDDPFYMDVHSIKNRRYLDKLQKVSNEKRKKVYAIFNDGAMIYDRINHKLGTFGNVICFNPIG